MYINMNKEKIRCIQCAYYTECSPTTRVFANYCGSHIKANEYALKKADMECREHQIKIIRENAKIPINNHFFHFETV